MIVKTKTKKQNPFRIQKMSQETGLAVQEIMQILSTKNSGLGAKVSGKKLHIRAYKKLKIFARLFLWKTKERVRGMQSIKKLWKTGSILRLSKWKRLARHQLWLKYSACVQKMVKQKGGWSKNWPSVMASMVSWKI